jgi:NADH-quinone oxidoreductase subunit F
MKAKTICALSDAAALPTEGFIKSFREEFEQHIAERRCPLEETDRLK